MIDMGEESFFRFFVKSLVLCYIGSKMRFLIWVNNVRRLNGGKIYLVKKAIICLVVVFLVGIVSSRLVKVFKYIMEKWIVFIDRGSGFIKLICYWLKG